jgi:group II intron reverse transcriptase/maturase
MERRGQQKSNLIQSTSSARSRRTRRHESDTQTTGRWIRIGSRASRKELTFNNLLSHINEETLKEAFQGLDGSKAKGVDGVSKKAYGQQLDKRIAELSMKIQRGSYRPQPKREVLIPKADGKTRPISIACFEDKIVDNCVSKILTVVYDQSFAQGSFGYRPNRSCHGAIRRAYGSIGNNERPHVVEIDFKSFFNTIPHKRLMKIISKRIEDKKLKGLIGRFLEGETLTANGDTLPSEIGTPQGSVMSPILANIYLDEVIDQWFEENYRKLSGIMVRYADDAIFMFRKEEEAVDFLNALKKRVESYSLILHEEKTKIINLSKNLKNSFNFLGFTFYWGKQGKRRILKVKTQKEKLTKGIKEFYDWIKDQRNRMKLSEIWDLAKAKIQGHINYYGYQMNALKIDHFVFEAQGALFKWLNRRSQKRSYTWKGFEERLKNFPLCKPLKEMKLMQLGANPYATAK